MTLFLRDKNNNTLVDLEIWRGDDGIDCSSVVDVVVFADILLGIDNFQQREAFIKAMHFMQEIREKVFFEKENDTEFEYARMTKMIREIMVDMAKEFKLYYVED